jgi:hypothetical protein
MAFDSNLMATLMTQAFFPCCLEFYFLTIFWPFAKLCFYTNKYVHCISLHEKIPMAEELHVKCQHVI